MLHVQYEHFNGIFLFWRKLISFKANTFFLSCNLNHCVVCSLSMQSETWQKHLFILVFIVWFREEAGGSWGGDNAHQKRRRWKAPSEEETSKKSTSQTSMSSPLFSFFPRDRWVRLHQNSVRLVKWHGIMVSFFYFPFSARPVIMWSCRGATHTSTLLFRSFTCSFAGLRASLPASHFLSQGPVTST